MQRRRWVKAGPPEKPLPTSPPGTLGRLAWPSHLQLDELPARLASAVDSAPRLLAAGGWFRQLFQAPHHHTQRPPCMARLEWPRGPARPPPARRASSATTTRPAEPCLPTWEILRLPAGLGSLTFSLQVLAASSPLLVARLEGRPAAIQWCRCRGVWPYNGLLHCNRECAGAATGS